MNQQSEALELAFQFSEFLVNRKYDQAILLTADGFGETFGGELNKESLQQKFEEIVPVDWQFVNFEEIYSQSPLPRGSHQPMMRGPIAILPPLLDDWADQRPDDIAHVYVGIADEFEGEGMSLIICRQGGQLRIREIEFGRP